MSEECPNSSIRWTVAWPGENFFRSGRGDIARGTVLADPAYGYDTGFREELIGLGLDYVVGVQSTTTVWPPGPAPMPPQWKGGRGRPAHRLRRDAKHAPVSAKQLALSLPAKAWRTVTWREGAQRALHSRFAAVRVRAAHRDHKLDQPRPEEWLLIEWPRDQTASRKYWLSNLPASVLLRKLVALAKQRWIIEGDYQELKQELGLGYFEGRGFRGFHDYATLAITAYGFLVAERSRFSPAARVVYLGLAALKLPPDFLPRGGVRPERHNPHSIATLRILLARPLIRQLCHCSFCGNIFL